MDLSFIPRARLLESLEAGFSLVPGHDYLASDWAILMVYPGQALEEKQAAILRFFGLRNPHDLRCMRGHLRASAKSCKLCERARKKAQYRARKAVRA